MFGSDIVNNMINFVFMYGLPLFVFIVLYTVAVVIEIRLYFKQKIVKPGLLFIISAKLAIAVIPMFYLDNTGAFLLSSFRLN